MKNPMEIRREKKIAKKSHAKKKNVGPGTRKSPGIHLAEKFTLSLFPYFVCVRGMLFRPKNVRPGFLIST